MKFASSQITYFFRDNSTRRNIGLLLRFLLVLAILIVTFSTLFHYIMAYEVSHGLRESEESWVTGFYWTLTVMSTLGFGDITFFSDLGRLFSMIVLLSGIVFLLVLLPFTFIQFFYAPWMESQAVARAPKSLPPKTSGHVILTHYGPITRALIRKLNQYGFGYVLIVEELDEALDLHDQGIKVALGERDNLETYDNVRAANAALLAATGSDTVNSNTIMTLREVAPQTPAIATAEDHASVDIMQLAGCEHVLELHLLLGQSLARRAPGPDSLVHEIARFDVLIIAEAIVAGTTLVGMTLRESQIRERSGLNVVGLWDRGQFRAAMPECRLDSSTVLVLAGSEQQLERFNRAYLPENRNNNRILIVGGGRVGIATAEALTRRGIDSVVIEQDEEMIRDQPGAIHGSAAELEVLKKAGIDETPCVIITTRDDDTNIYLTLYCRRLRPNIQIISRSTNERNVQKLHRAGANLVMSYASMGANSIFNLLQRSDIYMVGEGLNVFRLPIPKRLAGRTLRDAEVRTRTGCSVVALISGEQIEINPDPNKVLDTSGELILLGEIEAEGRFLKAFHAQ